MRYRNNTEQKRNNLFEFKKLIINYKRLLHLRLFPVPQKVYVWEDLKTS
jgi:hypothetical protein